MPAYQNCQHQGKGWCLACVGKLAEELSSTTSELIKANAEIAAMKQTPAKKCDECGVYFADHNGVCEGCLAYREHQQ